MTSNEMTIQENGDTATLSQPSVWFTPRFDIFENNEEYVLIGDLPGVEPSNLDVKFENQELMIFGRILPRYSGEHCFAEEYGVGDFRRSFTIGEVVDSSQISAELKAGVLTVHLPKRPDAKPRKIAVKAV